MGNSLVRAFNPRVSICNMAVWCLAYWVPRAGGEGSSELMGVKALVSSVNSPGLVGGREGAVLFQLGLAVRTEGLATVRVSVPTAGNPRN